MKKINYYKWRVNCTLNQVRLIMAVTLGIFFQGHTNLYAGNNLSILELSDSGIQQQEIKGNVSDAEGIPLPGVSILIKGTTDGTQTDFDGNYTLSVNTGNVLVFSFVGMISQEITVGEETSINVTLVNDLNNLDEVVVVGYGTQKKVNLTGAVGSVESEVLENKPVVNVQELLAGKIAGLTVSNGSGQPGSAASINIRGTSSIGGDSGVLVIIDGVPGNINTINPNDIENVSVLKDAASAAIYGARAANGVMLITTKSGKTDRDLKVSLTTSIGIQNPQHVIDFVGSEDFMNLWNLARDNDGLSPTYTQSDFDELRNGTLPDHQWNRDVFVKSQIIQNNYLSLSGSNERVDYRLGIGYDTQSGTLPRDKYNRLIAHPKFSFRATEWLSLNFNSQYTKTKFKRPQGGNSHIRAAQRIAPIIPIYTPEGRFWGPGGLPGGNPVAALAEGGTDFQTFNEMTTQVSAVFTLVKNLNITPLYSHRSTRVQGNGYTKALTLYNDDETVFSQGFQSNQSIYNNYNQSSTEIIQVSADYLYTINEDHNFKLFGLYSNEVTEDSKFGARRLSPAFKNIYVLDIGDQDSATNFGTAGNEAIESYVGRLNYNYKEKYLFEATVRRDGTSRFQEDYRWGTFPSFSAGWNIDKENFFEGIKNVVSKFKIRASWGELGDALKISRYETRNILSYNPGAYVLNDVLVGGAAATASFISHLSWETSTQTNLGIDAAFFDNKLSLTVDVFKDERTDILFSPPVPPVYGLGAPRTNTLKLDNKGFEVSLGYRETFGDFRINVNGNVSHSQNKVVDLGGSGPWIGGSTITEVGATFNLPYGLESDGLLTQADVDSGIYGAVKEGNIKYVDQNDDGAINGEDRIVLQDETPVVYGFNLGVDYKNFSLNANFYGRFNNYRYMSGYEGWAFYLSTNARPIHLDSWSPTNLDASYPRLSTSTVSNDTQFSDYWLEKADYLKLQNVTFSYKLPSEFLEKLKVDDITLSAIGQNLGIFTSYRGFDPEGGIYPQPRTITMSLQLTF